MTRFHPDSVAHFPVRQGKAASGRLAGLVLLLAFCGLRAYAGHPVLPPGAPDVDSHYNRTCISADCHPVELGGVTPRHVPYLEGRCRSCHLDHTSTGSMLLKTTSNSMCLDCHESLELEPESKIVQHPPDTGACTDCHHPHESKLRNLLRDREQLLSCSQCHDDFLQEMAQYPYQHQYFDPETECGSCHYGHQRSAKKYLRENLAQTCLTCHDMRIRVGARMLENVAHRIRNYPVVHPPLKEESCAECHTPHGAMQPALLTGAYPAGNYDAYAREQYELCWRCHDPSVVEVAETTDVTAFRDGKVNLHWYHVGRMDRGRACHLCHTAHASRKPHLIAERVLFRKWYASIEYTPTEHGGSCITPCHTEKTYDRVVPVNPDLGEDEASTGPISTP